MAVELTAFLPARAVDGDEFLDRGTLDVHIRWLRQKIERDASRPKRILTIRGVGHRYSDEAL